MNSNHNCVDRKCFGISYFLPHCAIFRILCMAVRKLTQPHEGLNPVSIFHIVSFWLTKSSVVQKLVFKFRHVFYLLFSM